MEELIYKYINNLLSNEEKVAFEQQLEADSTLADEVELEKIIQSAVSDAGLLSWQAEITTQMEVLKKQRGNKRVFVGLGIATVVAVLGLVMYGSLNKGNYKQLVESPLQKVSKHIEIEDYINEDVIISLHEESVKIENELTDVKQNHLSLKDSLVNSVSESSLNDSIDLETERIDSNLIKGEEVADNKTQNPFTDDLFVEDIQIPFVPCDHRDLSFVVSKVDVCEGNGDGEISINHKLRGDIEYRLFSENMDVDWGGSNIFEYLEPGIYELFIRDSSNCIHSEKITLLEKNCYTPELGFNPMFEVWEYENQWGGEVTFSIFGKGNELIYTETVDQDFEWNGTSNTGVLVLEARYLYIIEQNGVQEKRGYVTVLLNNR